MRIPKRVNTVLDWAEQHFGALATVVALVIAALAATLAPLIVGLPVAGFLLGLAAGGFLVHVRLSKRLARGRSEVDDLLRENGALRHRNTVLASGVITREAQVTQALYAIPEDDLLHDLVGEGDPQRTAALPQIPDLPELPDAPESGGADGGPAAESEGYGDLEEPEDREDTARNRRRA